MRAPTIDWNLARRITRSAPRELPNLDRRELQILVADLRVTARRAGDIAADHFGVEVPGAGRVSVVDWEGWGLAVRSMAEVGFDMFGLERRRGTAAGGLRALGGGALAGAGLRFAGPRLIGQYDAYTGADTLYLLAPTIVTLERRHGFVAGDFRLWVTLHEQAHALQFRAAPWLRDHILTLARRAFDDDAPAAAGVSGWLPRRGGRKKEATDLERLIAIMTFLEGQADHTADTAGRRHIPTQPALRRAFHRTPGRLTRVVGALDKGAQYRDGLAFCQSVASAGGRAALLRAFSAPEALPVAAEIGDPQAWLRRVDG